VFHTFEKERKRRKEEKKKKANIDIYWGHIQGNKTKGKKKE